MNLVVIPFHDLRKCQKEGFRTRDCHFIEHFNRNPDIEKVLIINRPITYMETIYKKIEWKTRGSVINKGLRYQISEVSDNCFAIDFLAYDIFRNTLKRKSWFFNAYGSKLFRNIIIKSLNELDFGNYCCVNFTLYSVDLLLHLQPDVILFDALDNWLRIPSYKRLRNKLYANYERLAGIADVWTTNSNENKLYFSSEFNLRECNVIKNGVDIDKFNKNHAIPKDLKNIDKPIIGIAAKITHLLDVNLLNDIVEHTDNFRFVLIGQILSRKIYNKLNRKIIYLGDKHYDIYPKYVKNFDICFIPYVVGEKEHGGDSIKVYEFLAAGKPIIATNFGGMQLFSDDVFIIKDRDDFNDALNKIYQSDRCDITQDLRRITWENRTDKLISLLKKSYASKKL